jgi:DNA-binding GntR family transcriptional regulator
MADSRFGSAKDITRSKKLTQVGTSLADQVWHRLRLEIIHGDLPPGTRLVELEIAERMGVSQGTVREALQRLETDGLVERKARTASYVAPISLDEMHELFLIRSVVESSAARRTAQRISPAQCEELRELVDLMRQAGQRDDIEALVDCDLEFHHRICEWSESRTLLRVWTPLYSQIQRFISQTHPNYFPDLKEVADTHVPIAEALCKKNADEAARLMHEHIMLIWSRVRREGK